MFQSLAVDYVLYLPQWHRNTPTDTNCGLYLSCSHLRELRRLTENTRPAASYGVSIAVFHFQCPAHEQRDGALRSVASVENQFQFRRHHTHWTYTLHIKEVFNYFKLCILFVFLMTYEIISLVVIFGISVSNRLPRKTVSCMFARAVARKAASK